MLEYLDNFVEDLNKTNSNTDKLKVINQYNIIEPVLFKQWMNYIFHYNMRYNVTSSSLKKHKELKDINNSFTIFEILDQLNQRIVTGNKSIELVNGFIEINNKYKNLIYKIIDRKLDCNISVSSINKIVPNTVSEFSVALANKYEKKRIEENANYFLSRKLDGIRCIIVIDNKGHTTAWSRQGKELLTLSKLLTEIETFNLRNIVLDGEICLTDKNGNEDFQNIMSEIRRKEHTIDNPKFKMFDKITIEEFENKKGQQGNILSKRIYNMKNTFIKCKYIEVLEQLEFNDVNFSKLQEDVKQYSWEGLMIRKDDIYKGKRSFDLMKVKKFNDAEYIVEDIEIGEFPVVQKDGTVKKEECVKSLLIIHKGNNVHVGSGLSLEERLDWFNNSDDIIGKTIQVKYFEETKNKQGEYSLRFPTLNYVYAEGRDL
jgi:ATP-dependent DNA ligase